MWTPITRRQHSREHLRHESDLTDAEWAIIAPFGRKHPDQIGFAVDPRRWLVEGGTRPFKVLPGCFARNRM